MREFFEKYHSLVTLVTLVLISIVMNHNITQFFGLEMLMILFAGFMSISGLLGVFGGGIKNITKISLITYLFSLLICVSFFQHLKKIDSEVREITSEYTLEETENFHLLTIEVYKLLYLDLYEIKYDDEHTLKLYEFYKNYLMDYYANTKMFKK